MSISLEQVVTRNGLTVNATFVEHSFHVLLGGNGSGKSTLLQTILGLLPVQAGKIRYDTTIPKNQLMAYVPQYFSVATDLVVTDVIALGAMQPHMLWRTKVNDAQISSLLGELQIAHLAKKSILSLSGGELALVSVARAFMQQAKYVLIDEAEAGLDFKYRHLYRAFLQQQQCTVIEVSHDPNYALSLPKDTTIWVIINQRLCPFTPLTLSAEVLSQVYDVPMQVLTVENKRFCLMS